MSPLALCVTLETTALSPPPRRASVIIVCLVECRVLFGMPVTLSAFRVKSFEKLDLVWCGALAHRLTLGTM